MRWQGEVLHPRFSSSSEIEWLRARWAEGRRIRIEDALAPGFAEALHEAALARPFGFYEAHYGDVRCAFWRQAHAYASAGEEGAYPWLEAAERLVHVELPALASAVTGQALRPTAGEHLVLDYYTRGSYLDAHTDQGADRLVAYVIGLTKERWAAEDGGHLEFLAPDERTVMERVAPGFGTIDLFCIYPLVRPHRVPLLRKAVTRLSINGWLTGELVAPGEE